jgi:predicted RNA-binding protein with RPS1 domain
MSMVEDNPEDFGAFIEVLPGKEGLLRIGRMDNYHVI